MPTADIELLYRKIERRLLPTLFLAYILNHLDRVNIGFGHLQMRGDIGLTDSAYSFAAGVYFIGYILFEVPANALIQRLGGRRVIAAMVAAWGLAAAATMAVQTPTQLWVARALLGALEAGFFPGVVFYLSRWLPPQRRGRALSTFMMAAVVAGLISGPLCGWLMETFHTVHGLKGWQWMFLLQGLPGVPIALLVLWLLPDGPEHVAWLTVEERALVVSMREEDVPMPWLLAVQVALRDVRVHLFTAAGFLVKCGSFMLVFWGPSLIQSSGVEDLRVLGFLAAVPNLLVFVAMAWLGASSDRRRERRWHFAAASLLGAVSLLLVGVLPRNTVVVLVLLSFAAAGLASAMPILWAAMSAAVPLRVAAVTIALVGSVSNLSGFVGPVVFGYAKQVGAEELGFGLLAVAVAVGGLLLPLFVKEASCWRSVREDAPRAARSQGVAVPAEH